MDENTEALIARVERLEARVDNLAELAESLAAPSPDYGGHLMYQAWCDENGELR